MDQKQAMRSRIAAPQIEFKIDREGGKRDHV
jgi:hypothetical protein